MLEDAISLSEFFATETVEPGAVRAVLGPRIRRARLERLNGMSLEIFGQKIATEMGRTRAFSNVTISNWETGRQEPSFEALVAIARLTRLPLRYFAGVGELDDYPPIDWLAGGRLEATDQLRQTLLQVSELSGSTRELVVSQLKSLIGDLYRYGYPAREPTS
jgi:transcriptional regulator with XRE-family HTH domain